MPNNKRHYQPVHHQNKAQIELGMKRFLHGLYKDYQCFVNISDLPNFKISFFDLKQNKGTKAYVQLPNPNQPNYILHAETTALTAIRPRLKPLYFHEFTHIWDHYTIAQQYHNLGWATINTMTTLYSEFHATVVEMQAGTGFDFYFEARILTPDSTFQADFEDVTLSEYLAERHSNMSKLLQSSGIPRNAETWISFLRFLAYYIGRMYFADKYVEGNLSSVFDLSIFDPILGKDVYSIRDHLYNASPTLPQLAPLVILQRKTKEHFLQDVFPTHAENSLV